MKQKILTVILFLTLVLILTGMCFAQVEREEPKDDQAAEEPKTAVLIIEERSHGEDGKRFQELVKPESAPIEPTETAEKKPSVYIPETEKPAEELVSVQGDLIGNFKIYSYCPCSKCCGKWANGITATGTTATAGRTIAVDPDVIPLGSKVVIDGHTYIAEDTGSGINGYTIDLYKESHEAALQWGVQYKDVYWGETE